MKRKRLLDILWKSSLLVAGAVGCDDTKEATRTISRAQYSEQIDRCLADAADCDGLCDDVFEPELYETADLSTIDHCEVLDVDERTATVFLRYTLSFECGRRPRGFVEPARAGGGAGAWLARIATLEAASVTAFARLARSLERLAAPRRLIASARRAIADEVRHARLVGALARRYGATPAPPAIARVAEPSVLELARDNALEGQVGETFGALVATCQGRTARDPAIRAVFARIARDEAGHAALAHRLAPWLASRLSPAERAEVRALRTAAIAALATDLGVDAADRTPLGIPDPAQLARAARATFTALA